MNDDDAFGTPGLQREEEGSRMRLFSYRTCPFFLNLKVAPSLRKRHSRLEGIL